MTQTLADPAAPQAAPERVVLHVGCGPYNPAKLHRKFQEPGWRQLRYDIDPDVAPDIVGSITDMAAVADASVDAVWSSHNVEHLYAHEVPLALAEFRRVLKAGGFALITLPDLQKVAELVAADKLEEPAYISPAGPIRPWIPSTASGRRSPGATCSWPTTPASRRRPWKGPSAGPASPRSGRSRSGFDLWAYAEKAN